MGRFFRRAVLRATVAVVVVCTAARAVAAGAVPELGDLEDRPCGLAALHGSGHTNRMFGLSRVVAPKEARAVAPVATAWQPIRILVFTDDLSNSSNYCTEEGQVTPNFFGGNVMCTAGDVLTSAKRQTLVSFLIPSAIQLHAERLMVQPESGNLVVGSEIEEDPICSQFSIPASHMTTGVANADFVLYMSAAPTTSGTIAWATVCQTFSNGRPSVGVANVSPSYIKADPQTVRVIAHELLHALGFLAEVFAATGMSTNMTVRGKPNVPVITSANVIVQAQTQFSCPSQSFMELEDMGGPGIAGSHWKHRSAKDELMAGISGAGFYTALTIAAMEDMGFYQGNYTPAELMMYGLASGCTLATSACVVNGVAQFPEMFCTASSNNLVCTSDRRAVGTCAIEYYNSPLPSIFQYFSDANVGGTDDLMDYCPNVQSYTNANCSVDGGVLGSSLFGVMSRCLDVTSSTPVSGGSPNQYALCAGVQCDPSAATYGVRVVGATQFTTCPVGTTLSLASLSPSFNSGEITCPLYESVCGEEIDASRYEQYMALLGDNARGVRRCAAAALVLLASLMVVVV